MAKKKTTIKKAAKKVPVKKVATKKMATKVKPKKVAKIPAKKAAKKKAGTNTEPTAVEKLNKASVARSDTANNDDKKGALVAFSIDDVEALVASRKVEEKPVQKKQVKKVATPKKKMSPPIIKEKPQKKRVLGAASLADILGFNPTEKKRDTTLETESIPKKWQKFYKLLVGLRQHVQEEIELHTADTLNHSSREDSGDLANYGNHQADAGTDTFDRDFALSLVSSEQDALNEIEEAILRIKDGTYGICEVTGKPIKKERLTAVPFARYSLEGQVEYEKNMRRKTERTVGGIFTDTSDAPKITSDDDD